MVYYIDHFYYLCIFKAHTMSRRIKLDPQNFNQHTDEGMALLEHSIKEVGAIESVTIDKNGAIISGNARFETFEKLGYTPKVIELSENEYPVIATNLEGEKRLKAAILANTTAKKNINLDTDLIQEIAVEEYGIDVEEIGVEIVDVSVYNPIINPSFGVQNVTDEQIQKKQEQLENKFTNTDEKILDVICPECCHEFKIKISELLYK